jgi:hypothetical protein
VQRILAVPLRGRVYPAGVSTPDDQPVATPATPSASPSALRAIPWALLGVIVAIFCVLIPGLHFILGPFGPLIGGFVASNRCQGGFGSLIVISLIMSLALAIPAAAATGMFFPDQASTGLAKAAPYIVFFYTGVMSFIGGGIGLMTGSAGKAAG